MAKVLIADDSKTMRIMVKAMLEKIGHEVVDEAANGLEAFDKYLQHKPDILISDITMPVLDGVSAIKKIKEHDPEAKVVLLTSNANKNKLDDALSAGVGGFLFKPTDETNLKKIIDQVTEE